MKPFKNILVTPLKKLVPGGISCTHSGAPQGYRVSGRPSSLLVPSHCGQYFGKRIESDKIGDGE